MRIDPGFLKYTSLAEERIKRVSKSNYQVAKFLFDPTVLPIFFTLFCYFRWLDDVIDSRQGTKETRLRFIREQKRLLDALYHGNGLISSSLETNWATVFILFDIENGQKLKPHVFDLLSAIEFDCDRRGTLPGESALYQSYLFEGRSVMSLAQFFAAPHYHYPQRNSPPEAIACVMAHNLRDFLDDVNEEHYNISTEEIARYSITRLKQPAINNEPLQAWVHDKTEEALSLMKQGQAEMIGRQPYRCHMAWSIVCAKYTHVLEDIKRNQYILRVRVQQSNPRPIITSLKLCRIIVVSSLQFIWNSHLFHKSNM